MTDCDICKIIEHKDSFKLIYEDELVFAILHESPVILGHTLVIPKKHTPILEEIDDKSIGQMFIVANKISSAIFDTMGAHGTNIILNNGTAAGQELPHVFLNVLPRKENDSLNLEWEAKKASDEELKTTQSMIKTFSEHIFSGRDALPQVTIKESDKPSLAVHHDAEEDYMIKALKRMP